MRKENRLIDNRGSITDKARQSLDCDSDGLAKAREKLLCRSRELRQQFERGEVSRETAARYSDVLLRRISEIDQQRGLIVEARMDVAKTESRIERGTLGREER
jgi:hypothetical protein